MNYGDKDRLCFSARGSSKIYNTAFATLLILRGYIKRPIFRE